MKDSRPEKSGEDPQGPKVGSLGGLEAAAEREPRTGLETELEGEMEAGICVLEVVQEALRLAGQGQRARGHKLLVAARAEALARVGDPAPQWLQQLWDLAVEDFPLWTEGSDGSPTSYPIH